MSGERIYEEMTKLHYRGVSIRVWWAVDEGERFDTSEAVRRLGGWIESVFGTSPVVTPRTVAKLCADAWPKINAIEVLDSEGNGSLSYNNWP